MTDQTEKTQANVPDNTKEKTPVLSFKNASLRQKVYFGFVGIILLTAANMGYTLIKITEIEEVGHDTIVLRQPAANLFQRLAQDLNAATALLNTYLLTDQKGQREEYDIIIRGIRERLQTAQKLELVKSGEISKESLQKMDELFAEYQVVAEKLYNLSDKNEMNAGLVLAQNTLNDPATQFLNTVNLLLTTEEFDLKNPKALKAYTTLQALRYNFVFTS